MRTSAAIGLFVFSSVLGSAQAQVVISQIYGAGGNSSATYTNDYIELFNRGAVAASLNGWSVQYAATTGTNWSRINLGNTTLQPGQYYLVQAAGGANGAPLPVTPDISSTSINMSGTVGKVALVNNTTTITAGTSCPTGATILDFIGYGTGTNCSETSPSATLSATTAAFRAVGGCTDAGNNSTDFSNAAPNPRNTGSTLNVCGGGGGNPTLSIANVSLNEGASGQTNFVFTVNLTASAGPSGVSFTINTADVPGSAVAGTDYVAIVNQSGSIATGLNSTTVTVAVNGDIDVESNETFQVVLTGITGASPSSVTGTGTILNDDAPPSCTPNRTISQIQGTGLASPEVGNVVSASGVVTAHRSNGFFFQEKILDLNSTASQGLFVFTSSAPPSAAGIGNEVCIRGTVAEFFELTELTTAQAVDFVSSGNTPPAPVDTTTANLSNTGSLSQLERYEGMRVRMATARVTGPTKSFGEAYITLPESYRVFRDSGLLLTSTPIAPDVFCAQTSQQNPAQSGCVPKWDGSPEMLLLDTDGLAGIAPRSYTAGDTLNEVVGPLNFDFGTYRILPEAQLPTVVPSVATPSNALGSDKLSVVTFNVEHFYNTSAPESLSVTEYNTKKAKFAMAVKDILRNPDIIGVAEFETEAVLDDVAAAVNAANGGATTYEGYLVEGNDVGGIDVGFLVNTSRVSGISVSQVNKTATFLCGGAVNTLHDRPPLVLQGTVSAGGGAVAMPVTVIMNHTRSLIDIESTESGGSSCPGQTLGFRVRLKRAREAEDIAAIVQGYQALGQRVAVMGDFNAYQFNDGLVDVIGTIRGNPAADSEVAQATIPGLVSPLLTNLVDTVPTASRYSYSFEGNSQVIDHLLINAKLASRSPVFEFAHLDADYPETLRSDAATPRRLSDHDAGRANFQLPTAKAVAGVSIVRTGMLYDRRALRWRATFRITNNSGQALTATPASPLYLVLQNLTAGVTVDDAAGTTDLLTGNSPYVNVPSIPNGGLVNVTVLFNASSTTQIQFQEQLFQGKF